MSEVIKLYVKQTQQSGGIESHLEKIEHAGELLFEDDGSREVSLGSPDYDFVIEVYVEEVDGSPELMHSYSVEPSQEDPDESGKPINFSNRLNLPSDDPAVVNKSGDKSNPSQEDPDETAKPGNLPGSRNLF